MQSLLQPSFCLGLGLRIATAAAAAAFTAPRLTLAPRRRGAVHILRDAFQTLIIVDPFLSTVTDISLSVYPTRIVRKNSSSLSPLAHDVRLFVPIAFLVPNEHG